MNKAIQKIEQKRKDLIEKELNRLIPAYDEARRSYSDTGYDRYYNKMCRLETEIQELRDYAERDKMIDVVEKKVNEIAEEKKTIKKTLETKLFYLEAVFPQCSEMNSLKTYIESL